jgi:hypothetical protein
VREHSGAPSFDYLVGSSKKRGRYGKAKCLGGLEIDHQFKLGGLKHGVWLVYELFRGAINGDQLSWSEAQIRDFVANRKSANPHLGAAVGI